MPHLVEIEMAFPPHKANQDELLAAIAQHFTDKIQNFDRIRQLQENTLVETRHLSLAPAEYFKNLSFEQKNNHFINVATDLATKAIQKLKSEVGFDFDEISSLYSNTVTGFAIPSLEARVMNRLPFKKQTKRVPMMGLGCMAGVAGINRVADYLVGHPDEAVLFFSVELCSLTLQLSNFSLQNLLSIALFGDGCAAVLLAGDKHRLSQKSKLRWMGSKSIFFTNTEDIMGWHIDQNGLNVILSRSVPAIVVEELPQPLTEFLNDFGLILSNIKSFLAHPGGPKVLEAMEEALKIPKESLSHSWKSLKENGNMSSVSVLDIFKRSIDQPAASGDLALSIAMGPAFSAELGLFQWS